jgi:hypothetical protein
MTNSVGNVEVARPPGITMAIGPLHHSGPGKGTRPRVELKSPSRRDDRVRTSGTTFLGEIFMSLRPILAQAVPGGWSTHTAALPFY